MSKKKKGQVRFKGQTVQNADIKRLQKEGWKFFNVFKTVKGVKLKIGHKAIHKDGADTGAYSSTPLLLKAMNSSALDKLLKAHGLEVERKKPQEAIVKIGDQVVGKVTDITLPQRNPIHVSVDTASGPDKTAYVEGEIKDGQLHITSTSIVGEE